MKKTFVDKLCCPFDKSDLTLQIFAEQEENIKEGLLSCNQCGTLYPIIHGVPLMIPDAYREKALERPFFEKWATQLTLQQRKMLELPE